MYERIWTLLAVIPAPPPLSHVRNMVNALHFYNKFKIYSRFYKVLDNTPPHPNTLRLLCFYNHGFMSIWEVRVGGGGGSVALPRTLQHMPGLGIELSTFRSDLLHPLNQLFQRMVLEIDGFSDGHGCEAKKPKLCSWFLRRQIQETGSIKQSVKEIRSC